MPTLLIKNGFKFFFYANEHEPMHIHVVKAGKFAKIELNHLKVQESNLKKLDLRKALDITKEHRHDFQKKWKEFFKR